MASVGQVTIDVTANTAKFQGGMTKAQQSMNNNVRKMKKSLKNLNSSMVAVVGGAIAFGAAFSKLTSKGFEYNKQVENATAGLTALTVATSSNTSALGKQLTIQEKYTLAGKEATKTMAALQAINAKTPHTLSQTNEIYKAMYVSMKNAGASNEDMIKLTEKISIAAGAAGIQFQSLLAGVDGLATGTVLANSDLGRFLTSLGLSNQKLKSTKDVTGLLLKTLSGFKALDTYSVAMSNFENAVDQAMGLATQSMFEDTKDSIKSITKVLNNNRKEIAIFVTDFVRGFKLAGTAVALTVIEVQKAATKLALVNAKVANAVTFGMSKKTKENIKAYKNEIALLNKQDELLTQDLNKVYNSWGKVAQATDKATVANKKHNDVLVAKAPTVTKSNKKKEVSLDYDAHVKDYHQYLENKRQATINFNKQMTYTLADPYEKLIITRENQLKKYGDNADARLLIEKNYANEVEKLNKTLIQNYNKAEDKKTKAAKLSAEKALEEAKKQKQKEYETNRNWVDGVSDSYKSYLKNAKDTYQQANNAFTSAMYSMEDSLVTFVKTGKLDFKSLADGIISDIARIEARKMVAGIASSSTSILSSIFGSAKGNVFLNGMPQQFAKGGLPFGSNLQFAMAGGGVGSMNEQGQEAIMPLTRGLGGELGVKAVGGSTSVVIQIENNSGNDVSAKQIGEMTRTNSRGEQEKVITFVMDGVNRNMGGIRDALKGIR